ncbi:hypothetical protein D3C71_1886610 [compost metagenome]
MADPLPGRRNCRGDGRHHPVREPVVGGFVPVQRERDSFWPGLGFHLQPVLVSGGSGGIGPASFFEVGLDADCRTYRHLSVLSADFPDWRRP